MIMRRFMMLALLAGAQTLQAQSIWDSSLRTGPQFFSYEITTPLSDKVSEMALPVFFIVPVVPRFTLDIGTAYAAVHSERQTVDGNGNVVTTVSEMNGLTDTQLRGNLAFGGDLFVITTGLNLPTGSAKVSAAELDAATRIGSDFLTFPVSGFGSGFAMTGGLALAHSVGPWNVGIGGSVRQSSEYEPFNDASDAAVKFTPGPELRFRFGADHPYGTGRVSLGLTLFKFGDDKANAATYNTGDRYVAQLGVNNSLTSRADFSFAAWNLFRTAGTLIDGSPSPRSDILNAMLSLGLRAGVVSIQPSLETRVLYQEGLDKPDALATGGLRLVVNRGGLSFVPGVGYTAGTMNEGSLRGFRATVALRVGG
jgi:hypothetical protein